jgi:hypothetical protein
MALHFPIHEAKKYYNEAEKLGMKIIDYARYKFNNQTEKKDFDKMALKKARKEKTDLHYNLFHPKNTLKTILDMAKASFILSKGENINMKPINKVISESVKVFDALPDVEKKLIKDDMQHIKELSNIEHLKIILGIDKKFRMLEGK